MSHKALHPHFVSAGVVLPGTKYDLERKLMENIRTVIKMARTTDSRYGRPTNDLCSIVESIVFATLPQTDNTEHHNISKRKTAKDWASLCLPIIIFWRVH